MDALLIHLIALLSVVICACAGFWFYRAARERKQNGMAPIAPEIGLRAVRNIAWDRAVRAARNRNH